MILEMALILVSLLLLWLGAEGLVRGGGSLAIRLGLTPLVVGLTVVAYGTSMPELIVSVKAALADQGDIAVGNVVGSNLFNICIILGLSAVIYPLKVQAQLIRIDTPLMIVAAFALIVILRDFQVGRIEAIALLVGILIYTAANVRLARRESRTVQAEMADGAPGKSKSVWLDGAYIIAGLGVLAYGSNLLVENAVSIAQRWGVSEAIIGLTIVAAGTSMPELATSVVAALRRQADIAVGNIVGSNIYNVLAILGAAGAVKPLDAPGVEPVNLWLAAGVSLLLFPLMKSGFVVRRWEGALLLSIYAVYLYLIWPTN